MARRISFSVRARCRASFKRSLSDCRECVLFSSAESLASSSRTCRSLRSRKARWLQRRISRDDPPRQTTQGKRAKDSEWHVRGSILGLSAALCRREALLLFAAAAGPAGAAVVDVAAQARVYAANRHGSVCYASVGRALLRGREAVEGESIVGSWEQAGFERFLCGVRRFSLALLPSAWMRGWWEGRGSNLQHCFWPLHPPRIRSSTRP